MPGAAFGHYAKKKSLYATERARPEVKVDRHAFRHLPLWLTPRQLFFLDESGVNLAMTAAHAWSPRGERAVGHVPKNWGDNLTVVAALRTDGIVAPMVIAKSLNAEVFESYIEQCLVPMLNPGDIVVWDNLNVHKSATAIEMVEGVGASVMFLPAYSPDLNPIEQVWSKRKAWLRRLAARTFDVIVDGIGAALRDVDRVEACNFFENCGYHVA
ncbi:MAG TPA: IS630 family transposase [Polyangiaceae bacterium]|nr:IS630 family transposase [Polyangiaceae bacterium]